VTLRRSSPRAGARWSILVLGVVALVLAIGASALAVHDVGEFELDKNASNDTNITLFGILGANVDATTPTIPVCRTAPAPAFDFTIQVEAERMLVTATAGGSFGGNCSGTKVNYTVTRGHDGTTAAAHQKSGVSGNISLVEASPAKPGPDWNQVYSALQSDPDTDCSALGLVACTFVGDGIGPSTFTVGSTKDHLPIDGWFHTSGASPDKAEILNAYAAKAIDGTDQLIYFGMDRYAVDGSTDVGFWFFQDAVYACPDPDAGDACDGVPDGEFAGEHIPGDILILGTFTQGGATTNIRVFEWVASGGSEQANIDGPLGAFGDCVPGTPGDDGCATVNNTSIPVPWNYTFKGASAGGWIPAGGLYEGGVNLTALEIEGCFTSFLAETRSSPEITAILKDFALGEFEACDSDLTTTPADASGTALTDGDDEDTLPEAQLGTGSAGVDITDSAVLDVGGISEWDGSLKFYICGPIATGTCSTGGLLVDTQTVDETTPQPIVSASANLTSVGRYCWRGEFTSTTTGVPPAMDASTGECFEVLPVTPTLDTVAWSSGDSGGSAQTDPVTFGNPLYDKAILSGTANQPGTDGPNATYPSINATNGAAANGSLTFTLIGPDDCATTATGTGTNPETGVTVSGDGDYFSAGFTPDAPGEYHWQASYSGDSPNTLSTSHNDACDDTDEDVTVLQLQPTMTTSQKFVPNDSATITVGAGAGDLAGSVTFQLYVDDTDCSGTAVSFGPFAVSDTDDVGDVTLTDTVSSNNTTAYSASSTFNWVVSYTSTNGAHLNVTSECGNETSSITIDDGTIRPSPTPEPAP